MHYANAFNMVNKVSYLRDAISKEVRENRALFTDVAGWTDHEDKERKDLGWIWWVCGAERVRRWLEV